MTVPFVNIPDLPEYSDWVTGWTKGVRFPAGAGNFSPRHRVQTGLDPTQPPIQWVPMVHITGVKWQKCEAVHLPPPSAEVKNACSSTFTSPIRLYGVVLR